MNFRISLHKLIGLALLLLMTACAPVADSPEAASPSPVATSSPQPIVSPLGSPTIQPSEIPSARPPLTPSPTASPRPGCVESAVFVADVTVNDNTRIEAGQAFVKTWQLRNTGTCAWDADYNLVFTRGNRMGSPALVPLAATAPNATLDLSVNLKAPKTDGVFTALYEIRNPQGKAIPIGLNTTIWVKIRVGNIVVADNVEATITTAPGQPSPTPRPTTHSKGPCQPQQSGTGLIDLINETRQQLGLRPLRENAQLTAAAQGHSDDMACNHIFSHTGSDGSSIQDRIVAAGYNASNWGEIIYAGGSAQTAFDWWMNDPAHHDIIVDPNMRDVGAAYTYVEGSEYGGYFTVDFGYP